MIGKPEICDGSRPVELDERGYPVVYSTLAEAQRVIAEETSERLRQFLKGARDSTSTIYSSTVMASSACEFYVLSREIIEKSFKKKRPAVVISSDAVGVLPIKLIAPIKLSRFRVVSVVCLKSIRHYLKNCSLAHYLIFYYNLVE